MGGMAQRPTHKRQASAILAHVQAAGVPNSELAARLGITEATLRSRLRDGGSLFLSDLEGIASHLDMTPADLLTEAST